MSSLGDVLFILGVLIPLLGLLVKNYMVKLLGFVMGTVAFLIFAQGYTDIPFSSSTFYIGFIPLAFALVDFAMFMDWVRDEYL